MVTLTDLRISNISAYPVEVLSGANPEKLPPRDGFLRPIGAIDGYDRLIVYWTDEDELRWEAIVRVEATH